MKAKRFQLTVPSRILYVPNATTLTGTMASGYDESGRSVRFCCFPEGAGKVVDVVCSYFKSKRLVPHYSAVTHCKVLSHPCCMYNGNLREQFFTVAGSSLLDAALGKSRSYDLATPGVPFCVRNPNLDFDSRTWYVGTIQQTNDFLVEAHQEFAHTVARDKAGSAGDWPTYPYRRVIVTQIAENEAGIVRMQGVTFAANLSIIGGQASADNRDIIQRWIRLLYNMADEYRGDCYISDNIQYVGSYNARWRSWDITVGKSQIYYPSNVPEQDLHALWPDLTLRSSFKFEEPVWYLSPNRKSLVYVDLDVAFKVRQLQSEAFLKAAEDIPIMNQNFFQTLGDLFGILNTIREGNFSDLVDGAVPSAWTDAWLAYRYSYLTNKADIQDFAQFIRRTYGKNLLGRMSINGTVTIDNVTCRCQAVLQSKNVSKLQKALYLLDRFGLCPDFYIIWDSIPYSFMVDWVLPIGDMVSRTDAQIRYSKLNYELLYCSYSLEYTAQARLTEDQSLAYGDLIVKCYTRWQEKTVPDLAWFYGYYPLSTNKWTWTKRGLDFISIFFGKK